MKQHFVEATKKSIDVLTKSQSCNVIKPNKLTFVLWDNVLTKNIAKRIDVLNKGGLSL